MYESQNTVWKLLIKGGHQEEKFTLYCHRRASEGILNYLGDFGAERETLAEVDT